MKIPQDKTLLFPLSRAELMESLQIDHVAVDPQWRGYGLQQRFIDWSMEVSPATFLNIKSTHKNLFL